MLKARFVIVITLLALAGFSGLSCSGSQDDDCPDGTEDCDGTDTSPTPTISPEDYSNASQAGEFALHFLSATPYSKLTVEVDVMEGASPDEEAVQTLIDYIKLLTNKPDGVTVHFPDDTIPSDPEAGENPLYTLADIKDLETTYRDNYTRGNEAVLYFLYVDGHSEYDTSEGQVVGFAYRGSSMVIFMGTVEEQSVLIQSALQKTVTVHEFGHEIGLVNNGLPMQTNHQDTDHGDHCNNSDCMMYWTNNSSVLPILSGDIPDFDDNCLADIAAAGGKDARGLTQPN